MLALSDHDRGPQPGWPASTRWERRSAAELDPGPRRAWEWMCGAPTVWTATLPASSGGGIECLIAVRDARRSQFAVWREALGEGVIPDGGIVSIADRGQRFQGQRNRTWTALEGNIHLCACFRPGARPAAAETGWTMLPAVAAMEAVREVCGNRIEPAIKWVNDIWVQGLKVAGVLTGTRVRNHTVEQAVFGVGLNVRQAPILPPSSPAPPHGPAAGCLRTLAGMPDLTPDHLLFPLIRAIARGYRTLVDQGSKPLLDAYRQDSLVLGRWVQIWQENSDAARPVRLLAEGVVESIEPDLSLKLIGHAAPIRDGQLCFREPPSQPLGL